MTKARLKTSSFMSFSYGEEKIAFECIQGGRASKNITIRIYPDCRVVVSAPKDTKKDTIMKTVKKRSRWIYNKLDEFGKQVKELEPKLYLSGERHYYLGKRYQLKIIEDAKEKSSLKLLRAKLEVRIRKNSPEQISRLLTKWYRERAEEVFARRLDILLKQAPWVDKKPDLHLRFMKSQWGNCSTKGHIKLNIHLIKAPCDCIDYVILHELCHLAEHNHSKAFYKLMAEVLPQWESTKQKLDKMACRIMQS